MTIFVTGGYGFIAGHVIEELQTQGHTVITNVRSLASEDRDNYTYLENCEGYIGDIRDHTLMRKAIERVDGVINLAGILGTTMKDFLDFENFIDNNISGSWSVIKACAILKKPLVQIAVGNYFEKNPYSLTKTFIEGVIVSGAKYSELPFNVVRGLNVYGPRQKVKGTGKIIPTFITKALNNEPINVYGGEHDCGQMDMIYVKDIAKILVDVMLRTINGLDRGIVYEAGTGTTQSVWQIANLIRGLCSSESIIDEVPMRAGESKGAVVVAIDPYIFDYTSLAIGLKETIEYYRNNIS